MGGVSTVGATILVDAVGSNMTKSLAFVTVDGFAEVLMDSNYMASDVNTVT